jgi:ribosome-associated translation inhibitor RaiA
VEKLEARPQIKFQPQYPSAEETAVIINCAANEGYEISPRFRRTVEERIARLERDAAGDEKVAAELENGDHIRRQMRLVAMQRAEALRMRLFLDRAQARLQRPLIEI